MKYIIDTEEKTFNLAKKFSKTLKGGEIICLVGNLGAGKTVFTKGLAAGLKVKNKITSPTFVLMKVYETGQESIRFLCHIDAYRLPSGKDLQAIGMQDYLEAKDTVTVIEWADKIKSSLPKKNIWITIQIDEGNRIIEIV